MGADERVDGVFLSQSGQFGRVGRIGLQDYAMPECGQVRGDAADRGVAATSWRAVQQREKPKMPGNRPGLPGLSRAGN
jgi:hypothetical protein